MVSELLSRPAMMQTSHKSGMKVSKFTTHVLKHRRQIMTRYGIARLYNESHQFNLTSTMSVEGVWAGEGDWPVQNAVDLIDDFYYIYDVKVLNFGFVDSQTNFFLQDLYMYSELKDTRRLELAEKFRLNLKKSLNTNDVGKIPIVSQLTKLLAYQVESRNDIAHSVKKVPVTLDYISEVVFVLFGVELIRELRTSDLDLITTNLGFE
jgi:hypothetical protein